MFHNGFHIEFISSVEMGKRLGVSRHVVEVWAEAGKILRLRNFRRTHAWAPHWLYPWNDSMYFNKDLMSKPVPPTTRATTDYGYFREIVKLLLIKNLEYGIATEQNIPEPVLREQMDSLDESAELLVVNA